MRAFEFSESEHKQLAFNGGYHLELLNSVLRVWLEIRDHLLCALSCEDGEWPTGELSKRAKQLEMLQEIAEDIADSAFSEEELPFMMWALLDRLAAKYGYTTEVNWGVHLKRPEVARNWPVGPEENNAK